jgi:hypothetical protein
MARSYAVAQNVRVHEPPQQPSVRIVVTDDLERRRLTVFFRLFLAIPHLIVVGLWGLAAVLVSVIVWIALLFEGRAPTTLQQFVASYVRYAVHVSAYVHLAAAPWPRFGGADGYPIDAEIDVARSQSRRGVGFRFFLALPTLILAAAFGGGVWSGNLTWIAQNGNGERWSAGAGIGGVAATAAVLAWFATLARRRMPLGLRDLIAYTVGYSAQATAYLLLVTDRFPTSDPGQVLPAASLPDHPVRLELSDELHRSRLTVFFRLLLALPHLIWLMLWTLVILPVSFVGWVVALITGRLPDALHRFIAAWVRYGMHVGAFLFLVGGPFPGFVGAAGSYPVDLAIAPRERQRRLVTLFRFLLAIPAFLVGGAYGFVVWIVAFLGWWYALFTGRMPEGLRNVGAVSLRYSAQTNAYLFLLTERYPFASPALRDRPHDVQLELDVAPPPVAPTGPPEIEPA